MSTPPAELDVALIRLLQGSLPALFGGATPTVAVSVSSDTLVVDKRGSEPASSSPRPTDQVDEFGFATAAPQGPYTLTRPPYPGPRRVRLLAPGAATPLADSELHWDTGNPQVLTLSLRPARDLSAVTSVQVLYGVTAVFNVVSATRTLVIALGVQASDMPKLSRAVALALAVIELNRDVLGGGPGITYGDGDYGAVSRVKSLRLTGVSAPLGTQRLLTLEADVALTVNRALRQSEGTPIQHIRTPGVTPDPKRPVQIDFDVSL